MARRNQQSAKLILLAIIIAPIVWLHDKIGAGGIIVLAIAITTIAIVASRKGKSKGSPAKSQVKSRQVAKETSNSIDTVLASLERMDMTDYLGKAAIAGQKGKEAAAEGQFDVAWRHYHEQKSHYLNHAQRSEFTPAQAIALDGSVHRSLANLLRMENRHTEALIHFLYYYSTSSKRTKTDEKQIGAYVNRAKLRVEIDEIQKFLGNLSPIPDFRAIQTACSQWAQTV